MSFVHAKMARKLSNNYHNYITVIIIIIVIIIVTVIITIIQYCVITFIIDKLCKSNTTVCFQAWMAEWLINSACL